MTDSDFADLYEELLYERASNGIRPVLYVSSQKDLECSVIMLLDVPPEGKLAGGQQFTALGFGQYAM